MHPEVPPEGTEIASLGVSTALLEKIRARMAEYGLSFAGNRRRISNTHQAMLVREWAEERAPERVADLHSQLFQAYFADGANLADEGTLSEVCAQAGLPAAEVLAAIAAEPRFEDRLAGHRDLAKGCGVTGVPAFIINERHKIRGTLSVTGVPGFIVNKRYIESVQPLEVLRAVLWEIAAGKN